jgi:DNA-binding response OmpR family regulator
MSIMASVTKEKSITSSPVLIIEDSKATAILIEEFLNSLGYHDVRISNTGKSGMEMFDGLINAEMHPIVFLDYNLPDVDARVILPHLLNKRPDTKVIVTTALEKTEQAVKNVIMQGAYQYLQKPIRFADVQHAIKILEEEAKAAEKESLAAIERIDSLLETSFVTLNKISEMCSVNKEKALTHLKELESQQKVVRMNNVEEVSCNRCGSVLIEKVDQISTDENKYHCNRCNNNFSSRDARKIATDAYRARLQFNLKDQSESSFSFP